MKKYSILFVCLGNYCRSPLAEGVFKKMVAERGLKSHFLIDSCGLGPWHVGKAPHEGSRDVAKKNDVSLAGQKGRQISQSDFSKFDLIIAMDQENFRELEELGGDSAASVEYLRSYDDTGSNLDVPDPYYTGDFDEVYEIITRSSAKLLDSLEEQLAKP